MMDDARLTPSILRASGWAQRKLFDVAEYYLMANAGVFPEKPRVELIEGEILEMAPSGSRHVGAVMALTRLFAPAVAGHFEISIQNPLRLGDRSEPEPDVVLLRQREDMYLDGGPPPLGIDAVLVVEVADSSLQYDTRVKMPLYARHGIAEFWLVDVAAASIMVCRIPTDDGYADTKIYKGAERVESLSLPGVSIHVSHVVRA